LDRRHFGLLQTEKIHYFELLPWTDTTPTDVPEEAEKLLN
jgi:hypothetical protein